MSLSSTAVAVLVLLVLILGPIAQAQEGTTRFEHITAKEGLSQSTVNCIFQDSRGFMWFGTQDGLNRYDGYQISIYRSEGDDSTLLSDNWVDAICEDADGILWIGTLHGGLNAYDWRNDGFKRYRHHANELRSIASNSVRTICRDHSGSLWIGTDKGLDSFRKSDGSFVHYQMDPADSLSLSDNSVWSVWEDRTGFLWVGTNKGLNRLDTARREFRHYQNNSKDNLSLCDDQVRTIFEDSRGALWVGTADGLDAMDRVNGSFKHFQNRPRDLSSLGSNDIRAIFEDRSGNLWVGGLNSGIDCFDYEKGTFTQYKQDPFDPSSLNNNDVLSIYQDQGGVLWIGTLTGGVNKLDRFKKKFVHYNNNPSYPASLGDNSVWSFCEDQRGTIWIGTSGGLEEFNKSRSTFLHHKHDPLRNSTIADDNVWCIAKDDHDILWLGTGGGLDAFDSRKGTVAHYRHDHLNANSLVNEFVLSLCYDSTGDLWVGSDGGLDKFDLAQRKFTHYRYDPGNPKSLSNNRIICVVKGTDGSMWIGTFAGGLNRFDPKTATFTRFENDPGMPGSLSSNTVWSVCSDDSGTIWVGTSGGLNKLDPRTGTFICYSQKNGFPNDVIYGILPDRKGNLWLSTNRGIAKLNIKTGAVRNYDWDDGLQSNEFNKGAFYRNAAGEMFFGGINGFNVFHPDSVRDNPFVPPVVITAFRKFGKPQKFLEEALGSGQITLSYRDQHIAFDFAALDYSSPLENRFAYELEGFDKDWISAGTNHTGTYTNLSGGTYILRVKGSSHDGVWNQQETSLRIVVIPPFWETIWFRLLSLVVITGSLWTIHTIRIGVISRRNRILQAEIDERHKVEAALRVSEERFEFFSSSTLDGISVWRDNTLVDGNHQFAAMFGYGSSEMIGMSLADLVAPESIDAAMQHIASRSEEMYELLGIRHNGAKFPLEVKGREMEYQGRLARVVISRDVTERKRMEELIRLHSTALEWAANVVVITDKQANVLWANRAFSKLTGYSEIESIGVNLRDLVKSGKHSGEFYRDLWETILSGNVWQGEMINRRKDGSLYEESVTITPVRMGGKEITHFVAIKEDVTARNRAQTALRDSEQRFQTLADNSPVGIFRTDRDGSTTYVNPGWSAISGMGKNEALGDGWLTAVHPDDRSHLVAVWHEATGHHTRSTVEYRFCRPDGSIAWVIGNSVPEWNSHHEFVGYIGTVVDITARKEAEDALERRERQYRTLVENSIDDILIIDSAGKIMYERPSSFHVLGFTAEEAVGRTVFDFLDPKDVPEAKQVLASAVETPSRTGKILLRVRNKVGEWRWCSGALRNLLHDPVINGIVLNYHDVTEELQTERLQRAVYRIAHAADNSDNLIILYGEVHRIVKEVMAAENFYIALYDEKGDLLSFPYFVDERDAATPPTSPGRGLTEFVLRTGESLLCDRDLDTKMQRRGDVELVGPSAEIWLGVPLKIDQKTIGVMAVQHYTDRKAYTEREREMLEFVSSEVARVIENERANEALRTMNQELEERVDQRTSELVEANKELEAFASSVSHDLRAPLRSITGFSEVLYAEYYLKLDETGQDYLRRIRGGAKRMDDLIENLLRFSRVSLSQLRRSTINFSRMVEMIGSELRELQADRKVDFIVAPGIEGNVDPSLFHVVLDNLLGNAWKFTGRNAQARIEFGVREDANGAVYFVKDDGAGFNMEYAGKLFGIFQRLHSMKDYPGTGVGLATVQRIIHRHGGRIWAEGAEGKGATFYFTLGRSIE